MIIRKIIFLSFALLAVINSAYATSVSSSFATKAKAQKGTTIGWNGVAPVGVIGVLNAHPIDAGVDAGFKGFLNPFNFNIDLGPDIHNTIGNVKGSSLTLDQGDLFVTYQTLVNATVWPGNQADADAGVSTYGFVTDPTVIGQGVTPFYGDFSIDVYINAGSSFDGIKGALGSEDAKMQSNSRVMPGAHADPNDFNANNPDAIDLYSMEIIDTSNGLLFNLGLGAANSFFDLTYYTDLNDSSVFDLAEIENRAISAFSGTYGDYSVLTDTYLFSVDIGLVDPNMIYTYGLSVGALAPNTEYVSEPMTPLLFVSGLLCFFLVRNKGNVIKRKHQ